MKHILINKFKSLLEDHKQFYTNFTGCLIDLETGKGINRSDFSYYNNAENIDETLEYEDTVGYNQISIDNPASECVPFLHMVIRYKNSRLFIIEEDQVFSEYDCEDVDLFIECHYQLIGQISLMLNLLKDCGITELNGSKMDLKEALELSKNL